MRSPATLLLLPRVRRSPLLRFLSLRSPLAKLPFPRSLPLDTLLLSSPPAASPSPLLLTSSLTLPATEPSPPTFPFTQLLFLLPPFLWSLLPSLPLDTPHLPPCLSLELFLLPLLRLLSPLPSEPPLFPSVVPAWFALASCWLSQLPLLSSCR